MNGWSHKHWLKMALVTLVLALSAVTGCGPPPPPPTPTATSSASFNYQIQVQAKDTGECVPGAEVIIAVGGIAPLDGITDANGFAIIFVPSSYAEKPAVLTVEAMEYEKYTQNINLNAGALPGTVQLDRQPAPVADFTYRLQVQAKDTGEHVADAEVVITVDGMVPLDGTTDANGLAAILVPAQYADQQARLTVEAPGYEKHMLNVDLVAGALPGIVQLDREPAPPTGFTYQVRVQAQDSGDYVADAEVVIVVDGMASLDGPTDANGLAEISVPASHVGQQAELTVEAAGYETYAQHIVLAEGELPDTVQIERQPATAPALMVASFDSCAGVNNLNGPMGAAYNPPDRLLETYVQETDRGCVAKLEYNVVQWSAFWMKLQGADLSAYSKLVFDIRADPQLGIPGQVKVELKRANNTEVSIIYISDITAHWQSSSVDLLDFGPTGYTTPLSALTQMNELVFVFEASRSGNQGIVYLDDIGFTP